MIVFTYTPTESLQLVKDHEPLKWITRLTPYIKALNTLRVIKKINFFNTTMLYCKRTNGQANIIYALASYNHIMSKINEYNTVCNNIEQYKNQLCALSTAIGYAPQGKADLQTHYQHKISELTFKKQQLLKHDEVIACLDVNSEIVLPK